MKKKIERLYLTANFKGLVEELETKLTKEETKDFLDLIEQIYIIIYLEEYDEKNYEENLNEIFKYFSKWGIELSYEKTPYEDYEEKSHTKTRY